MDATILDYGLFILSAGFMVAGLIFVLAGAFGVIRMPDFYTRLHAAGMTDTLGVEFILFGLILQAGFSTMTLKLLLVAFLLLLTSPTATHAIANAAFKAGLKPMLGPIRGADPTKPEAQPVKATSKAAEEEVSS